MQVDARSSPSRCRRAARLRHTAPRALNRIEQELAAIPGVTGVTSGLCHCLPVTAGNVGRVQGFQCGPDIDADRATTARAEYMKTLECTRRRPGVHDVRPRRCDSGGHRERNVREEVQPRAAKPSQVHDTNATTRSTCRSSPGEGCQVQRREGHDPAARVHAVRQDAGVGDLNFYVKTSLPPESSCGRFPRCSSASTRTCRSKGSRRCAAGARESLPLRTG